MFVPNFDRPPSPRSGAAVDSDLTVVFSKRKKNLKMNNDVSPIEIVIRVNSKKKPFSDWIFFLLKRKRGGGGRGGEINKDTPETTNRRYKKKSIGTAGGRGGGEGVRGGRGRWNEGGNTSNHQ